MHIGRSKPSHSLTRARLNPQPFITSLSPTKAGLVKDHLWWLSCSSGMTEPAKPLTRQVVLPGSVPAKHHDSYLEGGEGQGQEGERKGGRCRKELQCTEAASYCT